MLLCLLAEPALANSISETQCEEGADDLKRFAWWVIMAGIATTPIFIGTIILPFGGLMWVFAEIWWAFC